MKIISNKKWEEFKKLEETNIVLGNEIMKKVETIKELKADKRTIANENQIKIDELNLEIKILEEANDSKVKDIFDLRTQLELANKEIEDLKQNVRKVCSCKIKEVSKEDIEKEKKEVKKIAKKVQKGTMEEVKKALKSKEVEPKKRGRKPKNATM